MNSVRECMRDQWRQSAEVTTVLDLEAVEVRAQERPRIDSVVVAGLCFAVLWAVCLGALVVAS